MACSAELSRVPLAVGRSRAAAGRRWTAPPSMPAVPAAADATTTPPRGWGRWGRSSAASCGSMKRRRPPALARSFVTNVKRLAACIGSLLGRATPTQPGGRLHTRVSAMELDRRIQSNLSRARASVRALATDSASSQGHQHLRQSTAERELRVRLAAGGRHALVSHKREMVGTIRLHRFPGHVVVKPLAFPSSPHASTSPAVGGHRQEAHRAREDQGLSPRRGWSAWLRDWVCASTRSQSAPKRVEATGCGPNRANAAQEALDSWARREAEQQHVYRVWTL